jgi:FAD-dependent urate hydroxylase
MHKLKAVIVGAGMGGLTAALSLRQAGFDVEIYDRVPALRAAGAGVSLWPNGVKVLNRLGLGAGIASIGGRMDRICYRAKSGELLTDFSVLPLVLAVGQRPYPVARTDLQKLLLDALEPARVHLNAQCVDVEQDELGATAIFADGRRAMGDLVVAADGTHSVLRAHVLGHAVARRYVGYVNYNGLVPASEDLAARDTWSTYVGDHKRVSMMPVGDGRFYYFFDVPMALGEPPLDSDHGRELARHFAGWAEPVQRLIQRIEPARSNRLEVFDLEPLPALVRGRVALLGDAGHSTAPDLGQGGCQALEDGWVLAHQLLTTNVGVADALQRYQVARRSRTADIIVKARKRSDTTHGIDPEKTRAWYAELAREDGASILNAIAATVLSGPLG